MNKGAIGVKQIIDISTGNVFTLFLTIEGRVYAQGENEDNCLGIEGISEAGTPTLIDNGANSIRSEFITRITAGTHVGYAIAASGKLFGWGNGNIGKLGDGDHGSSPRPVKTLRMTNLGSESSFQKICTGTNHAILLAGSGKVYGTGSNFDQQLGIDGASFVTEFTSITYTGTSIEGKTTKDIGCGSSSSFILDTEGNVHYVGSMDPFANGVNAATKLTVHFTFDPPVPEYYLNNTLVQEIMHIQALRVRGEFLLLDASFIPLCNLTKDSNPAVCSAHGTCEAFEICKCNNDYSGIYCQYPHCYGIPSNYTDTVCSGNGTCVSVDIVNVVKDISEANVNTAFAMEYCPMKPLYVQHMDHVMTLIDAHVKKATMDSIVVYGIVTIMS
eukprot:CAMPEP_0117423936 /NCGR_PEP_ID=MMETSP0758-20121206/4460_1 /TAXON_ID=63605 /ORGANISM="Percolomonas cosmopolitus, Strain AE-1 (ATCC 50343)" /LENGTH=385 /DNA_ID=CAMNT_0005207423 /DNA_START=601 /DNA_END=1759 /DNA_ORIENTATION=+